MINVLAGNMVFVLIGAIVWFVRRFCQLMKLDCAKLVSSSKGNATRAEIHKSYVKLPSKPWINLWANRSNNTAAAK